jgi:hypothetical protein
MADTFIDPDATVNGDGSFETPYNTWTGRSVSAGNRVLQKYGTTSTVAIAPTGNGTAAARAVIGVYHPDTGEWMEDVVGGAAVNATGKSYGIGLGAARTYVTVAGFEVYGGDDYGILKESTASSSTEAQHCWIVNCILRDSLGVGADLRGVGNKVINCQIHGNASDGLFIRGNGFEMDLTRLWNNGIVGDAGDGVQLIDASDFYIHDSDIDHQVPSKQGLICTENVVVGTAGGLVVNTRIACTQYESGVTLAEQKTVQIFTPGVTLRGCTIEGGQFGAYMQGANGVLEDCLVLVTGSGATVGVAIREDGVAVWRNTVIGAGGAYGIDHSSADYTGVTINGNGLKGWAAGSRTHTGATYSHNGFEDCTIRNANSAGTEGAAGTGDVVGDLGLNASYVPAVGSAVDGTGLHLKYATDRAGGQRPNPPSIGAFEPLRSRIERI